MKEINLVSLEEAAMEQSATSVVSGAGLVSLPKSPKKGLNKRDPNFTPILVRKENMAALRKLQKSTPKPHLNLKYICDACVQIALEVASDEVIQRAYALSKQHMSS